MNNIIFSTLHNGHDAFEYARFSNGGRLGIGTTNPQANLHVYGNGSKIIGNIFVPNEGNLTVMGNAHIESGLKLGRNIPSTTTEKLYNNAGTLYWDGSEIGSGTITALNNQSANRLVTIGSTTTELDGESNLTFDGSTFTVTGSTTLDGNTTIDNNNYDNINNAKILIENNGIIQNISSQEFSNIIDKGVSSIYDYNGISYQKYFLHNVDIADSSNQTRLYIDGENETKNFNIHKFTSYFLNTRTNSFMGKFASGNVNCSHSYIVLNRKAAYGTIPKKLNVVHHNLFLTSPNASSTEYEIVTDVSNKKYYLAPKCYNEDSNDCTKGIAFLNSIETKFSDNLTSHLYNKTTTIDTNTTLKNCILKGNGSSNVVLYIDGSSSLITLDSNVANSIYIQILSRSNITNNKTNSFIFTAIVKNQSIKKILKETIYAETENDTIDFTINGSNQIILTCNSSVSHRWIAHINILEIKDTAVTNTIYKELNWFNSLNCNELIYLKNRGTGSVTLYTNGTSNEYTVDKYTSIDTKIRIIGISGNLICAYYYKGIIKRLNGNITILLVKNRLTPSNINWSTSITRSGTNTVRISCTGESSTATTWYAEMENNINIFNYE